MKKILFLGLALGSSLMAAGCASMNGRSRHQFVYVESNPPGAKILDKNKQIGTTPALVKLDRESTYFLNLEKDGQQVGLELETKYRWNESFVSNFVFLTYAPIGWLIDFWSGSAWDYRDPAPVKVGHATSAKASPSDVVVIAPTLATTGSLSEDSTNFWSEKLPSILTQSKVIPANETINAFTLGGFSYETTPESLQRKREILASTGATQIFISKLKESERGLHTSGFLLDAKSQKTDLLCCPSSFDTVGGIV